MKFSVGQACWINRNACDKIGKQEKESAEGELASK
jgi:hypothetical protein